jgi:hypothetical protein
MVSKKEVFSGLIILVAVPLVVVVLYANGWNLVSLIEQIVTGILVGVISLGCGLFVHGLRKKGENIPVMSSTEKKKSWRSKFRLSTRKDMRSKSWEMALMFVIFGPIMIIMMVTIFPSEPLEPQASLMLNFIKIFGTCIGIGFTVWGILLISNLVD